MEERIYKKLLHCLVATQGVCVECGEIIEAKSLRQHLEIRHWAQVKNKLCPTCGKAFRTSADIEIHLAVVPEEKVQTVICHLCGKELPHPKMLARVSLPNGSTSVL